MHIESVDAAHYEVFIGLGVATVFIEL